MWFQIPMLTVQYYCHCNHWVPNKLYRLYIIYNLVAIVWTLTVTVRPLKGSFIHNSEIGPPKVSPLMTLGKLHLTFGAAGIKTEETISR